MHMLHYSYFYFFFPSSELLLFSCKISWICLTHLLSHLFAYDFHFFPFVCLKLFLHLIFQIANFVFGGMNSLSFLLTTRFNL